MIREHPDKSQVGASHYNHQYNSKARLASYWHQIDQTLSFQPQAVLEVGAGSGFTTQALRREGVQVITLDVTDELKPDIIGSVRAIPLASNSIDVVLCCQVLEHLPFEMFESAFSELYRVASKGVVMSLPDQERCFRLSIGIIEKSSVWRLWKHGLRDWPRDKNRRPTQIDPQHYWEIGCSEIGLNDVLAITSQQTSCHTFRVFENPYHRFFIIKK